MRHSSAQHLSAPTPVIPAGAQRRAGIFILSCEARDPGSLPGMKARASKLLLTIFLYLPSCVHSSPKRGRFRSGLWRGGEAAPAPVEYQSAVPGGLLKAAWREGLKRLCAAQRLGRLCVGQKANAFARSCELARPGLRRGRVRERLKARRRRALPHGPERATGSVGRGIHPSGFAGRGTFVRAGMQGQPCGPELDEGIAQRDRDTPSEGMEESQPGDRRGNLPPWDRWGNSPDAGRTLRAGEQDGSAQNRRARSAGSAPSLI